MKNTIKISSLSHNFCIILFFEYLSYLCIFNICFFYLAIINNRIKIIFDSYLFIRVNLKNYEVKICLNKRSFFHPVLGTVVTILSPLTNILTLSNLKSLVVGVPS